MTLSIVVDMNLSAVWVRLLTQAGWQTVHCRTAVIWGFC
jgi:hypothetical protein